MSERSKEQECGREWERERESERERERLKWRWDESSGSFQRSCFHEWIGLRSFRGRSPEGFNWDRPLILASLEALSVGLLRFLREPIQWIVFAIYNLQVKGFCPQTGFLSLRLAQGKLATIPIFGTIEQNVPQPFLKVFFCLSGRSGSQRGQCPLVRELRLNIRLC